MATNPIDKLTLKDISKWPLAFLCVVLLWLAREYMFRNTKISDEHVKSLTAQIQELKKNMNIKDTLVIYWQMRYIKEIERNTYYYRQHDSVNRAALEKPAKDLLNKLKN